MQGEAALQVRPNRRHSRHVPGESDPDTDRAALSSVSGLGSGDTALAEGCDGRLTLRARPLRRKVFVA